MYMYVLAFNILCFRHDSPDLHPLMKEFLIMLVDPAIMILPPGSVRSGVEGRDMRCLHPAPEFAREGARWITGSLAASTIPGLSGFKRDRLKTFI